MAFRFVGCVQFNRIGRRADIVRLAAASPIPAAPALQLRKPRGVCIELYYRIDRAPLRMPHDTFFYAVVFLYISALGPF